MTPLSKEELRKQIKAILKLQSLGELDPGKYLSKDHTISDEQLDAILALTAAYSKQREEELRRIWKEIVKNDIAGPVKWETEDRIAAIQAQIDKGEI